MTDEELSTLAAKLADTRDAVDTMKLCADESMWFSFEETKDLALARIAEAQAIVAAASEPLSLRMQHAAAQLAVEGLARTERDQ